MRRKTLPWFLVLALASPAAAQEDLGARIEAIRKQARVPALGAALVTRDGLQGLWVTGARRAGDETRVAPDDLWHLGSCTKSMTATLIALLVARGDLAWETPLPELLPDIAEQMNLDLLDVTLVELLCHRAGLASSPPNAIVSEIVHGGLPVLEQRARFTLAALRAAPATPPRGPPLYSNGGYVVAGHLAEVAGGKSWETLMQELLFEPLGMRSAGFGPPGSPTSCDQPRGHTEQGLAVEPGPEADNPALIGPAGSVHLSLADWAKYAELHLRGCRGDVQVGGLTLTRAAFTRLHTAYDGPGKPYGYGWGFESRAWAGGDGTALTHNGSNTLWYCLAWLGLENGVAALVTTNQATPAAKGAADEVSTLLIQEFERRRDAAPR